MLKTFIIGVAIAALSSVASIAFVSVANSVLMASIENVLKMKIDYIAVIEYKLGLVMLDALAMIGISFVSALLPTILLKRIKPVEIIKAKE